MQQFTASLALQDGRQAETNAFEKRWHTAASSLASERNTSWQNAAARMRGGAPLTPRDKPLPRPATPTLLMRMPIEGSAAEQRVAPRPAWELRRPPRKQAWADPTEKGGHSPPAIQKGTAKPDGKRGDTPDKRRACCGFGSKRVTPKEQGGKGLPAVKGKPALPSKSGKYDAQLAAERKRALAAHNATQAGLSKSKQRTKKGEKR
mmetsp:Transcript_43408/g.92387  ORF Transcript_43408/g.92387 Transcript_43408/m.92387 type:complete len:205 (-) Transcript_43408:186-800(-)